MKLRAYRTVLIALLATSLAAPMTTMAHAQPWRDVEHRKKTRDQWRDIGIASGVATILGLVSKNGTVTTLGAIGTLYSAYRYEEDRKSASKMDRQRAALYSRRTVTIHGRKYKRRVVVRHGERYFQFVRA